MNPIIHIEHVTKSFRPRRSPARLLKGDFLGRTKSKAFTALRDVSFDVRPGESVGIIGQNGSGKSTLLKIVAGVTIPTSGDVYVYGRVASLLELGAGFHPHLTGRENVYLNAGILGMRHEQTAEAFERIVEFSGVGDYIDNPVETYSSGMYVRLAFAVAVHVDPDVFLVDEVLSVGDEEFQRKCRRRIGELKEQGKTILFVSHDLGVVNTLCNRVILLNRGEMIVRSSSRDTIQFYLRLVGGETSTGLLKSEDSEVVVNNGRLSLFHGTTEITSPSGLQMCLRSMEQDHHSTSAVWRVESSGAGSCVATGQLPRLPVSLVWRLDLRGKEFRCAFALRCEREVSIDFVDIHVALRTAYRTWLYGALEGSFPEILPEDVTWNVIVSPAVSCREAAATGAADVDVPVLFARVNDYGGQWRLQWANADYMSYCRVLAVGRRIPEREALFPQGLHELLAIEFELGGDAEAIRHRLRSSNVLAAGELTFQFEHGRVRIACRGEDLTEFVHAYASMLIGDLWNDSTNLRWDVEQREGDVLRATGHSRRFSFSQHWTLRPIAGGIHVRIDLEVFEPLDVQEHHFSVGLRGDYGFWKTDYEEGAFGPFVEGEEDWRHLNRSYRPGTECAASAPGLPRIVLRAAEEERRARMTAINTGYSQQARVLQALRTPDAGYLHFQPGTHRYFDGEIVVGE